MGKPQLKLSDTSKELRIRKFYCMWLSVLLIFRNNRRGGVKFTKNVSFV